MRRPHRIVLADRRTFTRTLLRTVLTGHQCEIVGETTSIDELVLLAATEHPDVAVTDVVLDEGPIDHRIGELVDAGVHVLVLSDDPSPERFTSVLSAGASGYLLYDTSPEQVLEAVFAVSSGAAALHPAAAGTLLQQWRRLRQGALGAEGRVRPELTPRELDVLASMTDGLATKAIARRLGVAVKTVENHKIRIFDKLGVRSQAHAVSIAIGHGLLTGTPRQELGAEA